jgi:chromosome segregation ATPase
MRGAGFSIPVPVAPVVAPNPLAKVDTTMAKSTPSELQELITQMQALQTRQQEETVRLRRRLEWLENRRREFFEIMTANSSDVANRRKLEETERQVDEIQALLTQSETELKSSMQEIRQRIIALRNEELTRLEEETRLLRERKDQIRNKLLPTAVSRVNALQEEEGKLGQRFEELNRRIRELNELDPSTIHQSQVA